MYNGDMEMVEKKLELSKSFRKMILKGKVNREVLNYVDPMRRLNETMWYDRDLLTNGSR